MIHSIPQQPYEITTAVITMTAVAVFVVPRRYALALASSPNNKLFNNMVLLVYEHRGVQTPNRNHSISQKK